MFHSQNIQRAIKACDGALMVIAGFDAMQLSGDMDAPFLQESNMWWLTGVEEPGWKVIIDGARGRVVLVRPHQSEIQQIFDGGMSDEDAVALCGAQGVMSHKELERELTQLARSHARVVTIVNDRDDGAHPNPAQAKLRQQLVRIFERVEPCNKQLASLRAIKQPEEIERIKKAIRVSTDAYQKVRAYWQSYRYEYEVEAEFTYEFRRHAAQHAYAPIVAAGPRACTLHYGKNAHRVGKKDAVVIDIGARVHGYAADITRTYSAAPTKRTIQVHRAVQAAQQQIIGLLGPDLMVGEYIAAVDTIMKQALQSLDLIKSMDDPAYRTYFPHAVSHGLGVDVHDSLGAPRYFKPGMVLTVEPGIYIPKEGIGVRIEDDILITADGNINMSATLSTDL